MTTVLLSLLAGAMSHLARDGFAAPLFWAMPFGRSAIELVAVPANHSHWLFSFLLHWSFALELAIWAAAALALRNQHRQTKTARQIAGPF